MSADDAPAGPLSSLINDARDGNLTVSFSDKVHVNADEFVYILRDCQAFKKEIRALQAIAQNIGDRQHWGLGEGTEDLESSKVMVGWFRGKAKVVDPTRDSSNNVYDILQQHYDIVDQIETLHQTIAQKYVETDQEFASEFNTLMANKAPSPIGSVQVNPGESVPGVQVGADK
ncbi:hypothetical protein [Nocardia nova]|uniref:hypothetical protein n=1 Tax=Nocardia nova TaxID=37330 RepID=UPI00340EF065